MAKITKISPFAPQILPETLNIRGVKIATNKMGLYKHKDDLMLCVLPENTSVAGVFTLSKMASDPVLWCRNALKGGKARALVVNSGCANTFTGEKGRLIINNTVKAVSSLLECPENEVFVASTGVIGLAFDENLIPNAIHKILPDVTENNFKNAVKAIETTDTFSKLYSTEAVIGGVRVSITGIAKGSGMIEPNMATMLGFIFTDANIPASILQDLLNRFCQDTFNAITVDSDSSTSDTLVLFATGLADNKTPISADDLVLQDFNDKLFETMLNLAKQVVTDGEGAQKLITVTVDKAQNKSKARKIAKSIANSPLVKTAIAGGDANWGRVAMAVGKTLEEVDRNKLEIYFGDMLVASNWQRSKNYDEDALTGYLRGSYIDIRVVLNEGLVRDKVYTCDLTHDYIAINGDYRS